MLDVSNEKAMHKSFCQLIDWMNKIRDTYNFGKPHIPSLMRDVITRINRQSNMPRVVKEKLQEARLRIRDEDSLNECFQVIFAVLMIYLYSFILYTQTFIFFAVIDVIMDKHNWLNSTSKILYCNTSITVRRDWLCMTRLQYIDVDLYCILILYCIL
jgi:hypothetical protein